MIVEQYVDTYALEPIINVVMPEDILIICPNGGVSKAIKSMLAGFNNCCPLGNDVFMVGLGAMTFVSVDHLPFVTEKFNRIITLDIPHNSIEEEVLNGLLEVEAFPNYHTVTSYMKE